MAIYHLRVNQDSSKTFDLTLRDNLGVVVPLSAISTATLTLWNADTFVPGSSPAVGIINGRNGQDIKGANNVVIEATSGKVIWAIQPEDNIIVIPRRQIERHRARFDFVLTNGTELNEWIEIEVMNLRKAS